jgi:hypothetical protein
MHESAQKSLNSLAVICTWYCPIICDDINRHAKTVHDLFDEFDRLGHCYRSGRLYFNPLCELIHCNEDMCESTFSFLERTYQIQAPCGKRPRNGYGLQLMRWHKFLAGEELATFTPMYDRVNVRYGSGPTEPLRYVLLMRDFAPEWLL